MLGIGLGGMADGFERGVGLGRDLRKQRKEREKDDALRGATTEGRKAFEAQGGGDWDAFYSRHVIPRKAAALLEAGDLDGAKAWQEWGEKDTNRRASRLFGEGMLAGQTGDMKTAIGKFIEAGNTRGYGGDWKIGEAEPTESGGWRVRATGPDDQEHVQEFATPDDVLRFGATFMNPEAAFEQWRETQADKRKLGRDLALHRGKAEIDTEQKLAERGAGIASPRDTVALRKQAHEELKDTDAYMDATPGERSRMIERRVREIGGGTGASAPARPRAVVDTRSGALVDPNAPQQDPARPGAAQAATRPEATGLGAPQAREQAERPGPPLSPHQQQVVAAVAQQIHAGADPAQLIAELRRAMVPVQAWPPELIEHGRR